MLGFRELMMRETEIVGAPDQIHAGLKRFEAMSSMTRSAGQAGQAFTKGGIQAESNSGVEARPPSRSLQQLLSLREQPMSHPPGDLDDPFFLRSFDDRANVQLRPDLQACSSNSTGQLDLLAEGPANTVGVSFPAVGQDEQGAQADRTAANLLEQPVSQAAITRGLDYACYPQACRNHHRQSHPGDYLVAFHPNFIGLNVHQVQLPLFNDRLMYLLTMHSCSITPSSYRPFIQGVSMHNGLDWASIGEQGHDHHDELLRFAQALEHGSPASAERFFARFAAIALPAAIMDDNRARISLASCRTHRVRAEYLRWVHWLGCTFLHKHILPGTLAFFNPPPPHRLVGSYQIG